VFARAFLYGKGSITSEGSLMLTSKEQNALINANNCWNAKLTLCLEAIVGQNFNKQCILNTNAGKQQS
jgi:hypothetical protein